MIDKADAIVIGSGGLGAATAFHLARRGVRRVVLVDKHEIGSQTSPRAAGMVSFVRKSEFMIALIKRAAQAIERFAEDTGQPLYFVRSGSLKVARRHEDAEVLQDDVARSRRCGLDVELIPAQEAHRLNPFLEPDGLVAVMRVGDDMYFDPRQVALGFALGAKSLGATLLPGTSVLEVRIEKGEVQGVETSQGAIHAPIVVDAAGAWSRQVAEACGIRIPLVPTAQQLFVTAPIPGAHATLPMIRIMDAAVYVRPCEGGLLWGVYEEGPTFFDMGALGPTFQIKDMPLDAGVLRRAAHDVRRQLPVLLKATVREHRGGIPTMTADGQHIVGPAPGVRGFFFATGCNVAGLSISPALGELLAAWIVDGTPPTDLRPLSVARFGEEPWSEAELRTRAAWQYRHSYGAA